MPDQPRFCEHCGVPLASGANFCEACGQPLSKPPAAPGGSASLPGASQPAPAQLFTPPPAPQPKPQQPFTPPPAASAAPQPYTSAYTPPPAKKRTSALPIILGVGGCLGLLCIAAVVVAAILFINTGSRVSDISDVIPLVPTESDFLLPTDEPLFPDETEPTLEPLPDEAEPTMEPLPTQDELPEPVGEPPETIPEDEEVVWPDDVIRKSDSNTFADDFAHNAYDWAIADDETRVWGFEDGHYLGHLYTEDWIIWAYLPTEFTPDSVAFDAAMQPGYDHEGSYGVMCLYQDEDNYHYVSLSPYYGEYSIGLVRDGEYEMLMDDWWQSAANFHSSPYAVNHIQVVCKPDEIQLYINLELETQLTFPPAERGRMALMLETFENTSPNGHKVLFDNLYAYKE